LQSASGANMSGSQLVKLELVGSTVPLAEKTTDMQKEQPPEKECTGSVTVAANSSTSTPLDPTASSVENMQLPADKRITTEDALSRVMPGEELVWSCCPNCNSTLAVYIRTSKVSVALGPIQSVHPGQLSTGDTHHSSD
jgi:hypothetical protein